MTTDLTEVPQYFEFTMPERIVCAANRYKRWGDKEGFVIVCGVRHHDMVMNLALRLYRHDAQIDPKDGGEQGFLNNRGQFLTREEAWPVALAQGQILRRVGGDWVNDHGRLWSENYC